MAKETFNYLTPQGGSGTGMMFPNWNNRQDITSVFLTGGSLSYTVKKQGWLVATIVGGNVVSWFFINGIGLASGWIDGGINHAGYIQLPVKSGDVLSASRAMDVPGNNLAAKIYFVPFIEEATISESNWTMLPDWNNKEEISADLKSAIGGYSHTFIKTGWLYATLIPDPDSGSSSTWSGPDIDSWKVLQLNNCTVGKYIYAAGINREDVVLVPVKSGDVVTHAYWDNGSQTLSLLALHNTSHVYFIPAIYQAQPECVSYVIETGHNEDNTAFYRKYSDGYIEQWGYKSVYVNPDDTAYGGMMTGMISLPVAFSNANYSLVATAVNDISEIGIGGKSATEFEIKLQNASTTSSNVFVNWHACGY